MGKGLDKLTHDAVSQFIRRHEAEHGLLPDCVGMCSPDLSDDIARMDPLNPTAGKHRSGRQ